MASKSKKGKQIVYLIPESESRKSFTYHYTAYKTSNMISERKKLRLKKFNPVKNQYEWFIESKLPPHTR
jgi:large subunit ribosomal protein L33